MAKTNIMSESNIDNSKNKNNASHIIKDNANKDNNPERITKIMEKHKKRKIIYTNSGRTKVNANYRTLEPLKEALKKAAEREDIPQSDMLDRYLLEGLKRDHPNVYEEFKAAEERVVYRKIGRPPKVGDNGETDPSPDT